MEDNMESLIVAEKTFITEKTILNITSFTQYFIVILAIITIIMSIRKNNKKNVFVILGVLVLSLVCNLVGGILAYPTVGVLADGSTQNQLPSIILGYILIIISIIIQLIPFIICLKNNKKVKKDEVKQNV